MHSILDPTHQPNITAEEIDAALRVAQQLNFQVAIPPEDDPTAVEVNPITPMQMEEVLKAAFDYRGNRYNGALRQEAERLEALVETLRMERDSLQEDRRHRWDVPHMISLTQQLLELLKDTPVLQTAKVYSELMELIDTSPALKVGFDEDED